MLKFRDTSHVSKHAFIALVWSVSERVSRKSSLGHNWDGIEDSEAYRKFRDHERKSAYFR